MNAITLTQKQNEYKSYKLPVLLYPTKMREEEDGKIKYHARTMFRNKVTMEDIASDLITIGVVNGKTQEEIVEIWTKLNAAIIDRILNGSLVDCGIGILYAKVIGSFDSKTTEFNSENHSIDIGFRTSKLSKQIASSVRPVIGQSNRLLPELISVTDVESSSSDTLTPGGQIVIKGKNLLVTGTNEDTGLYFVNSEKPDEAVCVKPEKMAKNSGSEIICSVPQLEKGTYKIKICTQKSKQKPAKETVSETFPVLLSVM